MNGLIKYDQLKEISSQFSEIDKMEASPVNEVLNYLELDEGESIKCVFGGITEMASQDTGEMVSAAVFILNKGGLYNGHYAMQKQLVGVMRDRGFKQGDFIQITRLGEKRSKNEKNWRYHTFSVQRLIKKA